MPNMPNLEKLYLNNNEIGDEGAEKVAAAMPSMPNLVELYLFDNEIGDAGAEKVAAALPSMPNLKDPLWPPRWATIEPNMESPYSDVSMFGLCGFRV